MSKTELITDSLTFDGITAKLTWIPGDSYEGLSPITQAYGFCFRNDGKLLTIKYPKDRFSQVPGGTVEFGETPEETLVRELDEEANVELRDCIYLGAQMVEMDSETIYQLRFAAKIKKIKKREIDPAKGIIARRRFINPYEYSKVSNWGQIGDAIVERAIDKLGIKNV